jgi:hypothetical protein
MLGDQRIKAIGTRVADKLPYGNRADVRLWGLGEDGLTLQCLFSRPQEEAQLPQLKAGDQWLLSDEHDPDCEVKSLQIRALNFNCASFFNAPDPKDSWKAYVDAVNEATAHESPSGEVRPVLTQQLVAATGSFGQLSS